ncbi:hypothetical protein T02_8680, partial [Trichinella nativa]
MYLKNYSSDYGNQQNFHRLHQLHQCTGPKQDIIQDLQAEDHFEGSATYGPSPSDEIILPTVPNEILYPPAHNGVIQFCENYILQSGIYTNVVFHSKKVASVFSSLVYVQTTLFKNEIPEEQMNAARRPFTCMTSGPCLEEGCRFM